jgi:2-polyprenyl-3-methyl-5-hydroxy-6-metoxy-1,4-benzoquinol methylase
MTFAHLNLLDFTWDVGHLPFIWKHHDRPTDPRHPDALPFSLTTDTRTGVLAQIPNTAVLRALNLAYAEGSTLSGVMEKGGAGQQYADAFIEFALRSLGKWGTSEPLRLTGLRVLEVGCGKGYLLSRLRDLGADVMGVEPGAQGQEGAQEHGIDVVQGYFPHPAIYASGKFDVVLSYGVLEHVPDPVAHAQALRDALAPGGLLLLGVPDCGPCVERGDVSILFHEHMTYFTEATLVDTLHVAGLAAQTVSRESHGDSVFVHASASEPTVVPAERIARRVLEARAFQSRVVFVRDAAAALVKSAWASERSVGIYVPSRFANYLPLLDAPMLPPRLRFFDDNDRLCDTYIPGYDVIIEPGSMLLRAGAPDEILIASVAFEDVIALKLLEGGRSDGIHFLPRPPA